MDICIEYQNERKIKNQWILKWVWLSMSLMGGDRGWSLILMAMMM